MRRLPVLVLLLSLGLPLVAAQVPGAPPPCGPIAATATSSANPVAPGERADVVVVVENNGTTGVQVTVAIIPAPPGWIVENPEDQTRTVAGGDNEAFTFTITPGASATGDFEVSFDVSGACALPAPGVPCPPNACSTNAAPSSALVRLAPSQGGGIPGLQNLNFPLEYLVAGVVLVGVAATIPFLLRKKAAGFVAECPEPLKMVRPGRGTSFPIEVRNASAEPVTAQFEIGPIPEGWTAFMPLPEVQLAGRETRSLWLMVRSPATAQEGDAADVEVRLRSAARPDVSSVVRIRAEVNPAAAEGGPAA